MKLDFTISEFNLVKTLKVWALFAIYEMIFEQLFYNKFF